MSADFMGPGGVPAVGASDPAAQTAPDQETFFDAVYADESSTWKERATLLHMTARDYWQRLEAAEEENDRLRGEAAALQMDLWATLHGVGASGAPEPISNRAGSTPLDLRTSSDAPAKSTAPEAQP